MENYKIVKKFIFIDGTDDDEITNKERVYDMNIVETSVGKYTYQLADGENVMYIEEDNMSETIDEAVKYFRDYVGSNMDLGYALIDPNDPNKQGKIRIALRKIKQNSKSDDNFFDENPRKDFFESLNSPVETHNPVYANTMKSLERNDKIRKEKSKLQPTPKREENPKINLTKAQRKLYLSESLFEEYEEE